MKKTILVFLGLILSTTTFAQEYVFYNDVLEAALHPLRLEHCQKQDNYDDYLECIFTELKNIHNQGKIDYLKYSENKNTLWVGVCNTYKDKKYYNVGLLILDDLTWRGRSIISKWTIEDIKNFLLSKGTKAEIHLYSNDYIAYGCSSSLQYAIYHYVTYSNQIMQLESGYQTCYLTYLIQFSTLK